MNCIVAQFAFTVETYTFRGHISVKQIACGWRKPALRPNQLVQSREVVAQRGFCPAGSIEFWAWLRHYGGPAASESKVVGTPA